MYKTILKIIWPYLQRFLTRRTAEYAADYLQARREQRLLTLAEQEKAETLPFQEAGGDSMAEILESRPSDDFLSSDAFWFTLSGILLGIALSVLAYILKREE